MPNFKVILGLIFAAIVIAVPWPLGGNLPFTRFWILITAMCLLSMAVIYQRTENGIARTPMIWVVLIAGIGFVLFQATPASAFLGKAIAITSPERFAESGIDSIDVSGLAAPPVTAISVYSVGTREKLVDLVLAVSFFFAATVLLTERRAVEMTLAGMVISGVFITFFGMIQNLSWTGKLFWQYELLSGGLVFSSFVNKNNAAGFLLIAFGGAVFFLSLQVIAWSRSQQPPGLIMTSGDDWNSEEFESKGLIARFMKLVSQIEPRHLYALTATVIILAGVVASLSRGGMLALAFGVACCLVLLARKNRTMVVALAVFLAVGGASVVYFAEVSESVVGKIESLSNISEAGAPRFAHWNDAFPFALEGNVVFGCGAGTYRYVTSTMQSFFFERSFAHAENVYLETLVEMGIVGTALLLIAIFFCFRSAVRLFNRREQFDQALGIAGLTTMVSVGVASFLDFGIYQPANFTVLAIMMGIVVGCDYAGAEPKRKRPTKSKFSIGLVLLILVVAILSAGWATYESFGIESRKSARRAIALINHHHDPQSVLASARSFDEIKSRLDTAISIRPDDSEAHFQLGEYYVARFRTEWAEELDDFYEKELAQLRKEEPEGEFEEIEKETIWQSTSLSWLQQEFRLAERRNNSLTYLLESDERVQAYLPRALECFKKAEACCPRLPKTQFRLAQMSAAFDPDGDEREHIVQTLARNSWSSQILFNCGLLALSSGDQEMAVELWAQCLRNPYTRAYEIPIVEFSMDELPMKQLFERVLPQNPENLIRVARNYFRTPELKLPMKFLLVHTERVIKRTELSESERYYYQAEAERLGEKFELAAENYFQALKLEPHQTLWRFEYAKCLHQIKNYDEAIRQLKKCELENSRIRSNIKNLLSRIRNDRKRKSN